VAEMAIFTIKTQHFKISSLDELSVERFEKAILDFKRREEKNWKMNF
jgi:hypothetical protein